MSSLPNVQLPNIQLQDAHTSKWTFCNWTFCNWTSSNWTFCGCTVGKGGIRYIEGRRGGYEEKSRKYSKFLHVSFSMVAWPTEQRTNRGWNWEFHKSITYRVNQVIQNLQYSATLPPSPRSPWATFPPFGTIGGHKWFSRFPANESLRRTGTHWYLSAKLGFYLPVSEISLSCRTASA